MDTFESALTLITKNCWMASLNIRHVYYSVPTAQEQQKCLKFIWRNVLYAYLCLPNGISCAQRLFTKLLKPVYANLRMHGHKNSGYIDDSILVGDSFKACKRNMKDTVDLVENLGFIKPDKKSVLIPTQTISFLGNDIDSVEMIVKLPKRKVQEIVHACSLLFNKNESSIRKVARVLGLMVSTFSAVQYGPLFYRNIEKEKIMALKKSKDNFECKMVVSGSIKRT